jgi:hypothetical protein
MAALAASPFALRDANSSLRLVPDAVAEDDAHCLALACRALRDALWARFPARPVGHMVGHPHAGKRLRTRDAAVGRLGSRVTADGMLQLRFDDRNGRPQVLPEGIGRLAYLPRPGLKALVLFDNVELTELPEGLCLLAGLEELHLGDCRLRALPEGIGALIGLRKLRLGSNHGLLLPEGLWSLAGLEELDLQDCGLAVLPERIGALAGLRKLDLRFYRGLLLPEGLWSLVGLEELDLMECGLSRLPEGIGALTGLRKLRLARNYGLTTLPEGLWSLVGLAELDLGSYLESFGYYPGEYGSPGLSALPEGVGRLAGLKKLDLCFNRRLTALPAGLGRLRNLEWLDLRDCPGLAALCGLQVGDDLRALLVHLATQLGEPAAAVGSQL